MAEGASEIESFRACCSDSRVSGQARAVAAVRGLLDFAARLVSSSASISPFSGWTLYISRLSLASRLLCTARKMLRTIRRMLRNELRETLPEFTTNRGRPAAAALRWRFQGRHFRLNSLLAIERLHYARVASLKGLAEDAADLRARPCPRVLSGCPSVLMSLPTLIPFPASASPPLFRYLLALLIFRDLAQCISPLSCWRFSPPLSLMLHRQSCELGSHSADLSQLLIERPRTTAAASTGPRTTASCRVSPKFHSRTAAKTDWPTTSVSGGASLPAEPPKLIGIVSNSDRDRQEWLLPSRVSIDRQHRSFREAGEAARRPATVLRRRVDR